MGAFLSGRRKRNRRGRHRYVWTYPCTQIRHRGQPHPKNRQADGTWAAFAEGLVQSPVINAQHVALLLDVNHSTASRLIDVFVEQGILQEKTGFQRNRLFEFGAYLSLFDKRRG